MANHGFIINNPIPFINKMKNPRIWKNLNKILTTHFLLFGQHPKFPITQVKISKESTHPSQLLITIIIPPKTFTKIRFTKGVNFPAIFSSKKLNTKKKITKTVLLNFSPKKFNLICSKNQRQCTKKEAL